MEKEIKKSNSKKVSDCGKGCNNKSASKRPNVGEIGNKNQGAKLVEKVIKDYKIGCESQKECKDYNQIDNI